MRRNRFKAANSWDKYDFVLLKPYKNKKQEERFSRARKTRGAMVIEAYLLPSVNYINIVPKENKIVKCCDDQELIHQGSVTFCKKCGLVVSEPEKRLKSSFIDDMLRRNLLNSPRERPITRKRINDAIHEVLNL